MRKDLAKKRVFMIAGHAHSGKTTLSEGLLFKTKSVPQLGKIEEGNTLSDYSEDEISRGSSINNSFLSFNHKGNFIQFIDTPGYSDFIGEVISASFAADFAVIVIDASAGVEVGTEKAWDVIRRRGMPCLFIVNKLDKENTSYEKVIEEIKSSLTKKAVSLVCPLGRGSVFKETVNVLNKQKADSLSGEDKKKAADFYSTLIENIAESNDTLLEKYLESGDLE